MPTYKANGVTITSPRELSPDELAQAFAAAPKAPEPTKAATPSNGEIPVLGQAVRDVNAKLSFGPLTELMTAIVPTTYPELAAVLGLSLLGGPLAGAVGGKALANAPRLAKWGGEALARVASAALPAAATGAVTGDAVTPGTAAAIGQGAVEAAVPAVRAVPGVSHWLAGRAAKLDAGKLVDEFKRLIPAWGPLVEGKKSVQAMFDTLVRPEGEQALWGAYKGARDALFSNAQAINSPALVEYLTLKAATPGASRFRGAAQAMRQAQRGGQPSMSPSIARELFDELEQDAMLAAKRISSDPRAGDMLNLVNAARQEIAASVPQYGNAMLQAWEQRGLGSKILEFFGGSKAVRPGVFGPKYDAAKAAQHLGTPEGAKTLGSGLENVARIVDRGTPGAAEGWAGGRASTGVPVGRVNVPLPISARSPAAPASVPTRVGAVMAPSFQKVAESLTEGE